MRELESATMEWMLDTNLEPPKSSVRGVPKLTVLDEIRT